MARLGSLHPATDALHSSCHSWSLIGLMFLEMAPKAILNTSGVPAATVISPHLAAELSDLPIYATSQIRWSKAGRGAEACQWQYAQLVSLWALQSLSDCPPQQEAWTTVRLSEEEPCSLPPGRA